MGHDLFLFLFVVFFILGIQQKQMKMFLFSSSHYSLQKLLHKRGYKVPKTATQYP